MVMLNGVYLSIILLPHFEISIPALLFSFFALWSNGYKKLCQIPLIVGLTLREDVGLHFFGVYILLAITFFYFSKKDEYRQNAKFFFSLSMICLGYSLIVIILQNLFFHSNSLVRIYLGVPAFHHVIWDFIKERFYTLAVYRPYIFILLFFSIIFAYRRKDIFQALGFFFVIPWVILSFFAITFLAGTLALYYSFPLLIALLWPSINYALTKKNNISTRLYFSCWRDACIVSGLSALLFSPYLFGYPHKNHFIQSLGFEWVSHWKDNQKTINTIFLADTLKYKNIALDNAVATLGIDSLSAHYFVNRINPMSDIATQKIEIMIFLPNAVDSDLTTQVIELSDLNIKCKLKYTPYMVARKTKIHYPELC